MIKLKNILFTSFLLLTFSGIYAQGTVIDRVISVVGLNPILQSELDAQYRQAIASQESALENSHCKILEELLYQKLLLAQAQHDSIQVGEDQVEQELERRISYYIQQFGSEEKFVAFYNKSVDDFKLDLKDNVRDMLLSQQMHSGIVREVTVTPKEVKDFYNALHPDSIPLVNAEVEVSQIIKKPVVSEVAKKEAKDKIEGILTRIKSGSSSFSTMAALYSEDPGSANRGGLYEHIQRGQFVPEWDVWAFKLKPNETSEVFETVYGYFIIQLIERRGNEVDARSLLISPKVSIDGLLKSKAILDTVYSLMSSDSITFTEAATLYSDDDETKNSGGVMLNPFTNNSRFQMNQLGQIDQTIAFSIDKLKVGEFTKPMPMNGSDGKKAYRIISLKSQSLPHRANLKDDYLQIKAMALAKKQEQAIQNWISKKAVDTFIRIDDDYKTCIFTNNWIN